MEITTERINDVTIFSLSGRLDTLSANSLNESLQSVINSSKPKVIIDLEKLSFISSSGFRILLESNKISRRNDGNLALSSLADENVREAFDVAGFLTLFHIYNSAQEALSHFS